MGIRMTPYRERIFERFRDETGDALKRNDVIYMIAATENHGIEGEFEDFLQKNPDARVEEALDFVDILVPPTGVEIVDDDDLPEEERNTAID